MPSMVSVARGSWSGLPSAEAVGVLDVARGHLPCEVLAGHARGARGVVDLVVHVGDVLDQRDLEALVLEEALEQGEDHEGPRVAHMHARVDRGAAGVDPDLARLPRLELRQLAGERVAACGSRAWGRRLWHGARRVLRYGRRASVRYEFRVGARQRRHALAAPDEAHPLARS